MNQKNDTPTPAGLNPEQAHTYHERAGIMEYDGHLPRQVAEAVALAGVRLGNPGLTAGAAGTCTGEPRCSPLLQPSPETGCSPYSSGGEA